MKIILITLIVILIVINFIYNYVYFNFIINKHSIAYALCINLIIATIVGIINNSIDMLILTFLFSLFFILLMDRIWPSYKIRIAHFLFLIISILLFEPRIILYLFVYYTDLINIISSNTIPFFTILIGYATVKLGYTNTRSEMEQKLNSRFKNWFHTTNMLNGKNEHRLEIIDISVIEKNLPLLKYLPFHRFRGKSKIRLSIGELSSKEEIKLWNYYNKKYDIDVIERINKQEYRLIVNTVNSRRLESH